MADGNNQGKNPGRPAEGGGQDDRYNPVSCSFCGQTERQVERLIAGPGVFICNECVALCEDILQDGQNEQSLGDAAKAPALKHT